MPSDKEVEDLLQEALAVLEGYAEEEDIDAEELPELVTFEDAEILTMNKGFVLRFPDRTEFQVTIVRSG